MSAEMITRTIAIEDAMRAHHLIWTSAIAAGIFAATGNTWADDEPQALSDLVVEAVRDSIIPPHFAGSSTTIDEETIQNSGARSVAELLAAKGGILLSSISGNLSDARVKMRGFGENSGLRVLLMVDGQPVNRPDTGGISWLEVPVSQIERIEILRGSQTARYGNNAVAGVIHIITKQGRGKPEASVEVAGGSDNLVIGRGSFRDSFDGHDLSVDVERNDTDGWRDHSASEVDSIGIRWKKEIAPGNIARFGISYTDEFNEFPGPLGTTEYLQNPRQSIYEQSGFGNQYFSEQATLRTESSLLFGKGRDWSFELPVATMTRDLSWNMGPGSHMDNVLETVSLTPVFKYSSGTWSAEAGLSYRQDTLDLDQFAQIQRLDRMSTASLDRWIAGAFTNTNWEPFKGWHVSGALRWECSEIEATNHSFTNPGSPDLNFSRDGRENNWAAQTGLRWEPGGGHSTWLRYDKIYRLPATDEIASYQGYPMTAPFNDRLQAETGHGLELGYEWTSGKWTLGANAFAQWLEGEIIYDYIQNLNVNLANTERYGVELTGGYQTDLWEMNVHYTWLNAQFTSGPYTGREVYLVPHHHVSAVLACHPKKEITVQAEWQATSDSFEGNDLLNNQPKLPSNQVTNLLLRYEPKPGLSIYARVNNLFDERYATVKYDGLWYPAAGRQFQIGIRREL